VDPVAVSFVVVNVACLALSVALNRGRRRELAAVERQRADLTREYLANERALEDRRRQVEAARAQLEPIEAVERYAQRLRDANEIHRYREPILRSIADAAMVCRTGALVVACPPHPTVHLRVEDWRALVEALKPYTALREDGRDPMRHDRSAPLGPVGGIGDDFDGGDEAA
jgi:hypothetical protein